VKYKRQIVSGLLLLQTSMFAGGTILPNAHAVQQKEEVHSSTVDNYHYYFGLGRSDMRLENELTKENFTTRGVTVQLGYDYNQYLAIEGRYTHHVGNVHYNHGKRNQVNEGIDIPDYPTDFSNIALYVKPTYSIYNISAYALLGYGQVKLTNIPIGDVDRAESSFQWGLGASYMITKNISFFIDYINMYEDKGFDYRAKDANIKVDAWTVGFTYKF